MAEGSNGLQVGADVSVSGMLGLLSDKVDQLGQKVDKGERRNEQMWQNVHLVPILGGALFGNPTAGSVLDLPDRFGPHDPYWWDVRRLSIWGFTAGTVNVYLNDATGNGELLAAFPVPGQFTWGKQLLLGPRDRLVVVVGSNITGNVQVAGQAVEVGSSYLPFFIT